ncbi:tyrosine-type recombinase/integrase [Natrinema halophilum]|uniref:tyrosine-type recombinase/integrase n=1 Tax=Natrinema halophilum TaxID=1699371 RepID=UPI003CCD60FB
MVIQATSDGTTPPATGVSSISGGLAGCPLTLTRLSRPKTVASARSVPVDLSLQLELCPERFTEQYKAFPRSRTAVNRRVNEAAETADIDGRVYPHCLRATAASYHAYQGVAPVPLQALMGWSDLATAQRYIRISGRATADALRQVHRR